MAINEKRKKQESLVRKIQEKPISTVKYLVRETNWLRMVPKCRSKANGMLTYPQNERFTISIYVNGTNCLGNGQVHPQAFLDGVKEV